MDEIVFKNVSRTFRNKSHTIHALKNVSLTIHKGDIFGVIGYSGAGKSTLVRMINKLEVPTVGQVIVEDKILNDLSGPDLRLIRKRIGMIFQHFNLLKSKSVFDNVAIPLVLMGWGKKEIRERVMELLKFVDLSEKERSFPGELSGGQKQRVGIARALASNPSILLCDEATSALDPQTTQSILDLLQRINQEYAITIVVITHEMGVIQKICNEVAVMEKGKIIERGGVLQVFSKPRQPTTQSFVQSVIKTSVSPQVLRSLKSEEKFSVFKLLFVGNSTLEPVVNSLVKKYNVNLNILYANMHEIQQTALGIMILQISGDASSIAQAENYLRACGIDVQEVKQG